MNIKIKIREAIPRGILLGLIYPLLNSIHRLRKKHGDPFIEKIILSIGVVKTSIHLRLPSAVSQAVGKIDSEWENRISDAILCPDNQYIPRVPSAGNISGSCITMHNGIKIRALGYYGEGILNLLIRNRGVHEPQEEKAFLEVLPFIKPGSVMIEVGAYWGFYSLWFASEVNNADCYLLEPDPRNLEAGRQNFKLNGQKAHFLKLALGNRFSTQLLTSNLTTLDYFCIEQKIDRIAILHADIQGAEVDMLEGAKNLFSKNMVDYVFISTHSQKLHYECINFLKNHGFFILCSADRNETYSLDGLIVAKRKEIIHPEKILISKKQAA
jgi:hypothetical protein